jgi:hypothetical protein
MKASLVAYDFGELHKMLELKLIKNEYIKVYPKWQSIQLWLLKIFQVKYRFLKSTSKHFQKCDLATSMLDFKFLLVEPAILDAFLNCMVRS